MEENFQQVLDKREENLRIPEAEQQQLAWSKIIYNMTNEEDMLYILDIIKWNSDRLLFIGSLTDELASIFKNPEVSSNHELKTTVEKLVKLLTNFDTCDELLLDIIVDGISYRLQYLKRK